MGMTIYTNVAALTSQRYLSQTGSDMSKNLERLSSGLRINSAADDASGLAISEKLRGQISGLQRASMNAQDGISLLQTAEGGLSTIQDMTQRMRELAVQAGNGVYTTNDRQEIQKEVDQLKEEINRVASSTEFNTKKLLNGDSTALTSTDQSDKINTIITGEVAEGNYNLNITVDPGENYVYKTNVMSLSEDSIAAEITTVYTTNTSNLASVSDAKSLTSTTGSGVYTLAVGSSGSTAAATADVLSTYAQSGSSFAVTAASVGTSSFTAGYLEVMFDEAVEGDTDEDVDIKYRYINAKTGEASDWTAVTLTAAGAGSIAIANDLDFGGTTVSVSASISLGASGSVQSGDKMLIAVTPDVSSSATESGGGTIRLSGGPDGQAGPTIAFDALTEADNGDTVIDYKDTNVYHASLDENTGNLNVGSLTLSFKENTGVAISNGSTTGDTRIDIAVRGAGEAATSSTKLSDLSQFATEDGGSIFDNNQTQSLTVYGNGTSATIYLEGDDTISDFETKLTNALVDTLGMGADSSTSSTTSDVNNNLVNYVSTESDYTNEAVQGTFVIQTAKLGSDSQLSFIGDQSLIDGLNLKAIQEGTNSAVTVDVTDAHTGESIGSDEVNDYVLRDVIKGVNVEIDGSTGLDISWDDAKKEMTFAAGSSTDVKLHVVDNAMEMQIGANAGQTISTAIPQVNTSSLGLDDIVMVDQDLAQASITKIDSALESISSIRATIGAQINRLEYTITGLDTQRENLTASESRIRDLDFASEMTEFTRNQILNQAGTSMLSQANSLPQQVLSLLG
ncbi:flagellin domain protein [Denitrovibrio acetiphilus DSM 12809]|uniref:Flagellin n=1 Tax=Denitrovibrio acetiphilus (strain DSM 12809 / NBRC 114555 / N2460) TaxID=522772 RepID=D4H3G5_DENA2|nr:flagellin [Denitrovibrio acetiphilus]ADD67249.1 flagellin domain protein [Denitrovibrio acetiphilus DSM 12809]